MKTPDDYLNPADPQNHLYPAHFRLNVRKIRALAKAMRQYGWLGEPLKVKKEGRCLVPVDGAHRVKAAQWANTPVPVIYLDS